MFNHKYAYNYILTQLLTHLINSRNCEIPTCYQVTRYTYEVITCFSDIAIKIVVRLTMKFLQHEKQITEISLKMKYLSAEVLLKHKLFPGFYL